MRIRSLTLALGSIISLTASAPAQTRTAFPEQRGLTPKDFPRVVPLAPNVYGYEDLRAPGFTTVSLIVIGSNGVLLADGQGSPAATQRLLDEIRRLTPLPLRWYVVGSDHGDHTAGNVVLPSTATLIAHPTSIAQLVRDARAAEEANARAARDSSAKGAPPPAPRKVIVPSRAIRGDREDVDLGGISVRLHFLGRAHTGGDLMVELPRERILFMSEAYLNRVFPAMRSAYPREWVQVVDRALGMKIDRYVPGHGFIEAPAVSREELVAYRGALEAVIAEGTRLHHLGMTADSAAKIANWGAYGRWFLAEQQAPIAIRRIFDELDGKLTAKP